MGTPAGAGPQSGFPRTFVAETTSPYNQNTFTSNDPLTPACPQALAGTPGSDPATKVLNTALNTPASFQPGGTVHYTYTDNPHPNPGTSNFTIQDCEVVYPSTFFSASDFDPTTGVLIGSFTKAQLIAGGTPIDGASLSGIRSPADQIYFGWQDNSPANGVTVGSWVCNFARDIANNHGGDGNRKVSPTCFQVQPTQPVVNPANTPVIYFGYADNYRGEVGAIPGGLPTPWEGSPNVIFVGCNVHPGVCPVDTLTTGTPAVIYDAGAVRIDNVSTTQSIVVSPGNTISTNEVVIGGCVWNPWAGLGPWTIPPLGTLILTQTGGPAPMCGGAVSGAGIATNSNWNLDTSEASTSCVPSGVFPVVNLTINGVASQLVDNQQIMNTQGVDRGNPACGAANEATNWTPSAPPAPLGP